MKYVTQKQSYTCGALAIINLFRKISYKKLKLKDVPNLVKKLNIDKDGCHDKDLKSYLKKEGFVCSSCSSVSFSGFKYLLKTGKEIIVTVETPLYSHYTTVIGWNNNGVFLANMANWTNFQKKKQKLSYLRPIVFYSFETIKKICYKTGHDLQVIIVNPS